MPAEFFDKLKNIRAFAFGLDGVLTDGKLWLPEQGQELRQLNTKDIFAIQYALEKRYHVAIISTSKSSVLQSYFEGLGLKDIYLDAGFQHAGYERFILDHEIEIANTLYMGDDIPDIESMKIAGVAACPQDAASEVKKLADYICESNGGNGCVREVIQLVLKAHGEWNF